MRKNARGTYHETASPVLQTGAGSGLGGIALLRHLRCRAVIAIRNNSGDGRVAIDEGGVYLTVGNEGGTLHPLRQTHRDTRPLQITTRLSRSVCRQPPTFST